MIPKEQSLLYSRLKKHKAKVSQAFSLVAAALANSGNPYVAFSGGKDSTAMLDIVRQFRPDVPVIYFDADCSYPETDELIGVYQDMGVNIQRWECRPVLDIIREHGLDNPDIGSYMMYETVWLPCKQVLDAYRYDWVFVGLRADESFGRRWNARMRGPIYYVKAKNVAQCCPLQWWYTEDVWAYVHANGLPYNRAYDYDGVERISYWAGTASICRGRWHELKRHWPSIYNRFVGEFPEVGEYV
jgi:3'-phosphoadenosine 5'-phosphosulfate sulfotransferase (PAPS reductase)/FAD synthetase